METKTQFKFLIIILCFFLFGLKILPLIDVPPFLFLFYFFQQKFFAKINSIWLSYKKCVAISFTFIIFVVKSLFEQNYVCFCLFSFFPLFSNNFILFFSSSFLCRFIVIQVLTLKYVFHVYCCILLSFSLIFVIKWKQKKNKNKSSRHWLI